MVFKKVSKGITYKMGSTLILYLLTGKLELSLIYMGITILWYYIHDLSWSKIKWSKNS